MTTNKTKYEKLYVTLIALYKAWQHDLWQLKPPDISVSDGEIKILGGLIPLTPTLICCHGDCGASLRL